MISPGPLINSPEQDKGLVDAHDDANEKKERPTWFQLYFGKTRCAHFGWTVVYLLPLVFVLCYLFFISVMPFYVLTALCILFVILRLFWSSRFSKKENLERPKGIAVLRLGYCGFVFGFFVTATISYFSIYIRPRLDLETFALGGVTSESIAVWVRAPESAYVEIHYKDQVTSEFSKTTRMAIRPDHDYTAVVNITSLDPDMQYTIFVQLLDQDKALKTTSVTTLLSPEARGRYSFGSTSCNMKASTWNKELTEYQAFTDISSLSFTFFLGDLIYADVPFLLYGLGSNKGSYYAKYRETFVDKYFQTYYQRTPTFYMFDDHEIINDYEGRNDTPVFEAALDAWNDYAGSANPTKLDTPAIAKEYYYSFEAGGAGYFVTDCHTHSDTSASPPTILGSKQLSELKDWLVRVNSNSIFKFLFSPTPWSFNFARGDRGWGLAREERQDLLDFIAMKNITGCIFVSGDAHVMNIIELSPGMIELSASPFGAGGPPSNTFRNDDDVLLFEQKSYGLGAANQYLLIDVVTNVTEPVVEAHLYNDREWQMTIDIYPNGTYNLH